MKILNLGCGTKTCNQSNVVNIDWSIYLRLKKIKILRPIITLLLSNERLKRFKSIADEIMVYDLSKGIPFKSCSVDVVYHSHMFEHLDKDGAENFLLEVKRVLKPGGIHRIVVPDFEIVCRSYIEHITSCKSNSNNIAVHDEYISRILEQSVRKEAFGSSQQNKFIRFIENIILGDARRRGETHQWMYDRINLKEKLIRSGYKKVYIQAYDSSEIQDWNEYGLDVDENNAQYKPDSLYIEAIK